ncbi:MAG: right-handed parallel beta-helix repeat-containing protein [Gemmataceae bacterium]|nr:right-handed parallel beta-helix repeat-containing protein [Gemmataceae bacterium]
MKTSPRRPAPRLCLEPLEDRTTPATFTVRNANDAGAGSLRQAVLDANATDAADRIEFDTAFFATPRTVTLAGELAVTRDVTIAGPGADRLTVSGNDAARVFNVDDGNGAADRTVRIEGLTVTRGRTAGDGGGVRNAESLTVADALVSASAAGFNGGGIANDFFAATTLTHSEVTGNSAGYRGGGVFNIMTATLTVTGATVSLYTVGYGDGGGVYNGGTLTLTESDLTSNVATTGGGLSNAGDATVRRVTVFGNSSWSGGGVYNGSSLTLTDSTVTANVVYLNAGGGVYNAGTALLAGVTVVRNSAGTGGGVYNFSRLTLANCVVADATGGGDLSAPGGGLTLTGVNLVEDGSVVGAGVLNVDPLLGPLADNGGPTQTHLPAAGSPVIDAGDDAEIPPGVTTDQRGVGFPRVAGVRVDLGAVEVAAAVPLALVVDTFADESDGNYGPGELSLREAIDRTNANPGADTVAFDPAVFGVRRTITLTLGELRVTDAVTVTGPGSSLLTVSGGTRSRVFAVDDGDAATALAVTVSGLRVYAGNAGDGSGGGVLNREDLTLRQVVVSSSRADAGGGVFNDGTLTFDRVTVSANTAGAGGGGGVFNAYGRTLTIAAGSIASNTASGDGGGVLTAGTMTMTGGSVSRNTATYGGGIDVGPDGRLTLTTRAAVTLNTSRALGGGLYSGGFTGPGNGRLTLTDASVTGNRAGASGGGVYLFGGTLTVTRGSVSTNSAVGYGGGLAVTAGSAALTDVAVADNVVAVDPFGAGAGGGAYTGTGGSLTLTGVTLSGNRAGTDGGGVANLGTLTAVNTTVSGNTAAGNGGGVFTAAGAASLAQVTAAANGAAAGGGVYAASGTATLANTVVADSTAGGDAAGAFALSGRNLVEDGSVVGTGVLNVDPGLTPLGLYGGRTKTHTLRPASPALDGGDTAAVPPGLATDQRGKPRVRRAGVDLGAVESGGFTLRVVSGANQSARVNQPFAAPLVVRVTAVDGATTPVAGAVVTFTGPAAGAGITPSPVVVVVGADGLATVAVSANGTAGRYAVTITTPGANAITLTLTNTAP